MRRVTSDDRGAAALIVAISMLVLMGFAALVVDIGAGFNERAQDQSAADTGALAGAGASLSGVDGIRDAALAYVKDNLDTNYAPADWQTLWESCSDPDKSASFQPVDSPWTAGAKIDCISIDPIGFVRVRVPDQVIGTSFGRVIGFASLTSSATAVAKIRPLGKSGVLPFGLASDVKDAEHVCLSSAPTGLADDPCVGSESGNFGTLKGRQFGNPSIPTQENCTASPVGSTLAINIAVGLDHWVTLDLDADVTNEVRDYCKNLGVDTLNTDVGFPNNGAEEGLATGPVQGGLTPRLQQGSFITVDRFGNELDNYPLWKFIDGSLADENSDGTVDKAVNIPTFCLASGFDAGQSDWDGDGTDEKNRSWQHMQVCLDDYVSGNYSSVMFTTDGPDGDKGIEDSPRFGYVPQFHEPDLGTGNSWLHVLRFKAVWLQGTWWKKGNTVKVFNPGENCSSCNQSSYGMIQLSAFVIPNSSLPVDLRGDPQGANSLNPYTVELYQ